MEAIEEVINQTVIPEDLQKYEKKYHEELEKGQVSHEAQFDYSMCLVRGNFTSDIQKGIILLEDLSTRHSDGKRDYIYFLAIAHTRIKDYSMANKYAKAFLQIEPNNQQVLSLQQYIKKKLDKEAYTGMAVAGGAALVVGGLVGMLLAAGKK